MAFNINSSINMKSINKVSSIANNVAFKDKFYDDVEKGTYEEIDYSDAAGIDIQEGIEAANKAREDRIKREQEEARRKAEEARLKLEQERQAKLDKLNDLYKQRDDNNGLFHPFKEAEIEEKIRKLEKELAVPHKPDGWESFCDTCEDAAATAVSFVETAIDTTATFGLSVVEGVVDVGETIVDGAVQVGGGLIAYGVSAFDEEAGAAMKKGIQDFVAYDASKKFYDTAVDLAGIDEDIAYGWAHTAGNITGQVAGYAAITVFTGGAGTMALSGLAAAGSTAETAYANGASFDEAMVASTINGIVGAAAGKGMDKLGAFAKGATSLKGVMGYAAGGVAIGATEPFVNTVVEYNTYGNNNGQSYLDYMDASGGWTKVGIGAGAGGVSIGVQAYKGYKSNKVKVSSNLRKLNIGGTEVVTELTDDELIKFANDFYGMDPPITSLDDYPDFGVVENRSSLKIEDGKLTIDWVENQGAVAGTRKPTKIAAGTEFDRYGNPNGNFVGAMEVDANGKFKGVDLGGRRIIKKEGSQAYTKYTVLKDIDSSSLSDAMTKLKTTDPDLFKEITIQMKHDGFNYIDLPDGSVKIDINEAKIAPAYGHKGGGTQYELPIRTGYLKELGFISY